MPNPNVAVITRTKDRPIFLERAINSVLSQTYNEFVMVIVNDGGEPKAVDALVEKNKQRFKGRVNVVHNKDSVGVVEASNMGLKKSKSKYITFLDDDDTWHPDFLSETILYLENNNLKGVVTAEDVIWEAVENGKPIEKGRQRLSPDMNSISLFSMLGANQFPNNSFVFSREVLSEIGHFDPRYPYLDDWEFNIRFIQKYDIGFINKALAYYHRRPEHGGSSGNSIYLSAEQNRQTRTAILNKYLREDLSSKNLGVGSLANISEKFFYDESKLKELDKKLATTKERVTELHGKLDRAEARLAKIESLNTSLLKKSRRYVARRLKRSS